MGFKLDVARIRHLRETREIGIYEAKEIVLQEEAERRLKLADGWDGVRDVLLDLLPYIHLK